MQGGEGEERTQRNNQCLAPTTSAMRRAGLFNVVPGKRYCGYINGGQPHLAVKSNQLQNVVVENMSMVNSLGQ